MGSQRVDDRERWFRENLLGTQSWNMQYLITS
jgi:hypothetical protein